LIRLTKQIWITALEASWQRCTDQSLPNNVRVAVEQGV
jgi:hypothetical protein